MTYNFFKSGLGRGGWDLFVFRPSRKPSGPGLQIKIRPKPKQIVSSDLPPSELECNFSLLGSELGEPILGAAISA